MDESSDFRVRVDHRRMGLALTTYHPEQKVEDVWCQMCSTTFFTLPDAKQYIKAYKNTKATMVEYVYV